MSEAQTPAEYLQIAQDRLEDARELLSARRNAGAYYLSGYGVECSLKSLLLERSTPAQRPKVLKFFRGKSGHDVERIKKHLRGRGVRIPARLTRALYVINTWSVHVRYDVGPKTGHETQRLIRAVGEIVSWVEAEL